MSKPADLPDDAKLDLEDDVEDLFASPESGATTHKHTPSSNFSSAVKQRDRSQSEAREARDARLRAELERIREVNRTIEGVNASLNKAKGNMDTVHQTVNNASTLLATWTRILSQTEHNQRLILNPNWHGATQDLDDLENEEARRQQAAERRALEEQIRREEALRKAEEEERRKAAAPAVSGRGSRGTRGTRGSTRGYIGVGGQTGRGRGVPSSRGSGIGRGTAARGRGRGLG
ncbi:DASH complex subunit duo1-like protein [Acrodontium crateriforme]|uniref:DASH complex subunit DUO1 n=1 Tax=Acrodontium crateriforme TaxID=150365 RepID=A0AAQ3M1S5_9PEZI|nr:DASH complex subunit duo1-like protein [Acrodontium crateriforme]